MTQTALDFSYKQFLNFTNREEYLKFRAEWKKDYLEKIQEIRKLKRDLKQAMRDKPYNDHYAIRRGHRQAIADINSMLSDKRNAAQEAQRQYLAQKEAHHDAV